MEASRQKLGDLILCLSESASRRQLRGCRKLTRFRARAVRFIALQRGDNEPDSVATASLDAEISGMRVAPRNVKLSSTVRTRNYLIGCDNRAARRCWHYASARRWRFGHASSARRTLDGRTPPAAQCARLAG